MRRPAALLAPDHRAMTLFVAAELVLALAIPFLAIGAYHTLLESPTGTFVTVPSTAEPGWRALVEPSPVSAVVEVGQDRITGVALLATPRDPARGGAVVLVPGSLVVAGAPLAQRTPAGAVDALARELRLGISATEVVDEQRWASVLGARSYEVANPDPVVGEDGATLLTVGPTSVGAANAAVFLGRPTAGSDEITVLFRRRLLWSVIVADPPRTDDPLVATIEAVGGPGAQVVDLPLADGDGPPAVDQFQAETLIREVVPIPAGARPGDRVLVRVLDRTGRADLPSIAAEVASTGVELVEIGNAAELDAGPTELLVPPGVTDPELMDLARRTRATTVQVDDLDVDPDIEPVVTLLIGADHLDEG